MKTLVKEFGQPDRYYHADLDTALILAHAEDYHWHVPVEQWAAFSKGDIHNRIADNVRQLLDANGRIMEATPYSGLIARKPLERVMLSEMLSMLDKEIWQVVIDLACNPNTTGVVLFENVMMDSSACGDRKVMCFGPRRTYTTLEEVRGRHLGDVPSRFLYPQIWAANPRNIT